MNATTHSQLSQRVMLVRLRITGWNPRKRDKELAKEIADRHGTDPTAVDAIKRLIDDREIRYLSSIENESRKYHYMLTLPWSDDGYRMLPSPNFTQYSERVRKQQAKWEQAVQRFIRNYEILKEQAKLSLNSLYKETDYPTTEQVRNRFQFETKVSPLPDSEDFRLELPETDLRAVKQEVSNRLQDAQAAAMKDIWKRLYEVVAAMTWKMHEQTYDEKKGVMRNGIFRDSLVENIKELLQVLPALNVMDDPELTALTEEVGSKLTAYAPDTLRKSPQARKRTAREAEAILKKMEAYIDNGN